MQVEFLIFEGRGEKRESEGEKSHSKGKEGRWLKTAGGDRGEGGKKQKFHPLGRWLEPVWSALVQENGPWRPGLLVMQSWAECEVAAVYDCRCCFTSH